MKFSDGMSFDTSGSLRIERRSDGLYVVGDGMLMAVNTYEEGKKYIDSKTSWISKATTSELILNIDEWNRGEFHAHNQETINSIINELRNRFPNKG